MQRDPPPGPRRSLPPGAPSGRTSGPVQIVHGQRDEPDDDEKLWGMVAHVAGMFLPVLGPLAMWFLKREESEFVAFHCAQATIWSFVTIAGTLVITVVTCGAGGVVYPLFWLASAYFALQAREGNRKAYPGLGRFGNDGELF